MDRVLRYDYRDWSCCATAASPIILARALDRPRNVRMAIDTPRVRVAEILRNQLKQAGQTGA
jgi:hypothetical protein